MNAARPRGLDSPVDPVRDHVLGNPEADITLVEYGSYVCSHCHAAHEVIRNLRDRFGDRLRYVFRHLPLPGDEALESATLAEYAGLTTGKFWEVHDALMSRGPSFGSGEFEQVAAEFELPPSEGEQADLRRSAAARVNEDARSGRRSGARGTPTFFIGNRRYEGAWDEVSLTEAMEESLGHRLQTASLAFARWAPSTGLLLLIMTAIAIVVSNTAFGPAFRSFWESPFGFRFGDGAFSLPLIDWINHGLLSIFFLVVGLEIKHELTVGRLASRRAAALPIAASIGGMIVPALIYLLVIGGPGPLAHGWGITIATDTAFAVALIILLGDRVPVDLRVFLTAAVIVDDLVAIAVVALFYSGAISLGFLAASVLVSGILIALNRWGIYRPLPYAVTGAILWFCLHEAGLHATLAGVILAVVTPTRPPANLHALMAQAQAVLQEERRDGDAIRHGPSVPALRALDAIHDRIESPASRLLRTAEPWSSYVVLPIFAIANAGVVWDAGIFGSHLQLIIAIVLGLVVGKPLGIVAAAWVAVRIGVAIKQPTYTWRQLAGAGALAGIGFTMSLFIAGQAFDVEADFAAAKIAIFAASVVAGLIGVLILRRPCEPDEPSVGASRKQEDRKDQSRSSPQFTADPTADPTA